MGSARLEADVRRRHEGGGLCLARHPASFSSGVRRSFVPWRPQNAEKLDSVIIYDRDFDYDYFGFKV